MNDLTSDERKVIIDLLNRELTANRQISRRFVYAGHRNCAARFDQNAAEYAEIIRKITG